jgi:Aspartyl/Asparaginyl beta-hydroxylase/L-proline 3-hydroxylase, C-terminal
LDDSRLAREVEAILALELHPCDDAVGDWRLRTLWKTYGAGAEPVEAQTRRSLPYLDELIARTFRTEHITLVRIFTASRGGFIRPHRDWTGGERVFTRFHLPLQTNDRAFNSEDDVVFHMRVGEIWFLDGARPHSGGCFAETPRVHLVIDFDPAVPVEALFGPGVPRCERRPSPVERAPLTDDDVNAIRDLAVIATDANLGTIANLLGALHFERRSSCSATYERLLEIARAEGSARLLERAERLRDAYVGSPSEREGLPA